MEAAIDGRMMGGWGAGMVTWVGKRACYAMYVIVVLKGRRFACCDLEPNITSVAESSPFSIT